MSKITGNIMSDWKKENDFATEMKKMMKLYEDEHQVICIQQDEINEASVGVFYVYNDYYANKVDGVLRVTTGQILKDEDFEYRYLERAVKFYKELDESCFVVSPHRTNRDYNGMIKFIYNSFIKGNSVFISFQEYAGTPIWIYTHWARSTKEFSPKEYCIEDVLRAIGHDFRSCLHA